MILIADSLLEKAAARVPIDKSPDVWRLSRVLVTSCQCVDSFVVCVMVAIPFYRRVRRVPRWGRTAPYPPGSTDLPSSPCRRLGSPVCRGPGRPFPIAHGLTAGGSLIPQGPFTWDLGGPVWLASRRAMRDAQAAHRLLMRPVASSCPAGFAAAIARAVWRRTAPLAPSPGHTNIIKLI